MLLHMPLSLRAMCLTAALACPISGFTQGKAQPAVDSDAIAALEKMGKYLQSLKAFEVTSTTLTDQVMEDGVKLKFGGNTSVMIRRPNRARIEVSSDRKQRQLFYDGKSITLYGPRVKYYATVAAPPTLHETAEMLAKKYGIEMPLADLFYWGTDKAPVADIKSAAYIGPATVDGASTDHYWFRQEGVDWQIWIQKGKDPLPRKLVITTTSEPTHPEYSTNMRWNVAPKLDDTVFVFKPPQGARKIVLQNVDGKVEGVK
jgi:hypothetical protein